MGVTVELTYDMSKALGMQRFEVDGVRTVADVVRTARERFGDAGADFEKLTRVAAVAVNGVLVNHRRGMKTKLAEGDVVAFVKAAAGG
jgi:molybdopterin converting factor small subunit